MRVGGSDPRPMVTRTRRRTRRTEQGPGAGGGELRGPGV